MKSFIYGIDGADRRIFDYFDMPFYKQLQSDHVHIDLKEDLLNRGWSEIITGHEGKDTGGFYMSPELDGTTKFSMKYKMGDVTKKTGIKLIWDALPENTKVGVMNIPSLLPVVPVNGFCVGSAGAGISKIDEIDSNLVYPEKALNYLKNESYIPDIRLNSSGIDDIDELFLKLKEMETRRVDCYIQLARDFDIDFGLLIDRGTTVIQYLFMSEIRSLMDRDSGKTPDFSPSPGVEENLRDFYLFVDQNIECLYRELKPEQFILTSDHGHEAMTHNCNPNTLLAEHDLYFSGSAGQGSFLQKLKFRIKKALPRKYRAALKANLPKATTSKLEKIGHGFDNTKTLAFSHWYMPGIFLNDERFNGPVKDSMKASLISKICDIVNDNSQSVQHGITASSCRESYTNSKFSEKLPDIRLNIPDYIFVTCRENYFINQNPFFGPVNTLQNVYSEMHTGTKNSFPMCLVDSSTSLLASPDDKHNLTLIYQLVLRHFSA